MVVSAKETNRICLIDVITVIQYRFLDKKIYIMESTTFQKGITRVCFGKRLFKVLNIFLDSGIQFCSMSFRSSTLIK